MPRARISRAATTDRPSVGNTRLLIAILVVAAAAAGWWLRGASQPSSDPDAPAGKTAPTPTQDPARAEPKATPSTAPRLVDVTWKDATLAEVVTDLAERLERRLSISDGTRKKLEKVHITLHIEDELVTHVLARVLQPYELGCSIRAQEVLIFPDDD